MKKRFIVLTFVLITLLLVTSVTAFGKKDKNPLDEITRFVEAGGGSLRFVPDVVTEPFNFQGYPETFEDGLQTWDLDMIDVEKTEYTGAGVYVAVLDTGLDKNWRAFFPEERIATELGRGFVDKGIMKEDRMGEYVPNVVESKDFHGDHPHGTHVSSTVIGYSIRGTYIDGVAPNATIIPVKVLETYPALDFATFGTDAAVAAGIEYIAELAESMPEDNFVINMSLGSLSVISDVEAEAIDHAIAAGVIIVTSAGNDGTEGMGSPASYGPVISVGASGWAFDGATCTGEWVVYDAGCFLSGGFWTTDVPEDASADVSYITDFSARERPLVWPETDQNLDVVAPGSWVVGPYPVDNSPQWWANSAEAGGQYYFVGGTSMASPHVAGVAALMLEKDPTLVQADVESILQATADPLPLVSAQLVADPNAGGIIVVEWGLDGFDAVGSGLVQADAALDAIP